MSGANQEGGSVLPSPPPRRLLLSSPTPTLRPPPSSWSRALPSLLPLILLDSTGSPCLLLDTIGDVGYLHLEGHSVPSQLPSSALAELSLVDASGRRVSNLLTLGFLQEEQEVECVDDPALVFDVDDEGEMDALPAVAEYVQRMQDVGMQVVAMMSECPEAGFGVEPFAEGRRKLRCLMRVSKVAAGEAAHPAAGNTKAWVMDDGAVLHAVNPKYILDYFWRNSRHS
ncbi:hypothetical protein E2562_028355 [Oryza meyeriana var. granulata]|uniref:Uncharacterized protein n=1 Tax=Oryza meyeriana var. granulata TaxID=110450 RepID=A0A6G1CUA3_9ORYZ|nr:hypothetical protein E2562_028355 [Oryza meyeriana var. granulata]